MDRAALYSTFPAPAGSPAQVFRTLYWCSAGILDYATRTAGILYFEQMDLCLMSNNCTWSNYMKSMKSCRNKKSRPIHSVLSYARSSRDFLNYVRAFRDASFGKSSYLFRFFLTIMTGSVLGDKFTYSFRRNVYNLPNVSGDTL